MHGPVGSSDAPPPRVVYNTLLSECWDDLLHCSRLPNLDFKFWREIGFDRDQNCISIYIYRDV